MVLAKEILKDIEDLTVNLISCGLCSQQNFPSLKPIGSKNCEISYENSVSTSIAMKNIRYEKIYKELDDNKNYNFKMIDGALIQLFYRYKNNQLSSHRLAFFPSPFLESFQNEPGIYEEDEIYADILAQNISPVPIRFDYDPDTACSVDTCNTFVIN